MSSNLLLDERKTSIIIKASVYVSILLNAFAGVKRSGRAIMSSLYFKYRNLAL